MPNIPLIALAVGDRVQHGNLDVRFGRIVEIQGKYARIDFEGGGEQWIHVHMLGCSPSEDEIYGRLTREIQAGWSTQRERNHRGIMAREEESVEVRHVHVTHGRDRIFLS